MNKTTTEQFDKFLRLNIGGTRFDTTLDTLLTVEPWSKLAQIIQEDYRTLELGEELFIDRNGLVFQHILEVRYAAPNLRDGA